MKSMLQFLIFNDRFEKVHMSIDIYSPISDINYTLFKMVCFQEFLKGFYAFCVLYVVRKWFHIARVAHLKVLVTIVLVLVIGSFSLFFLLDLSTLQLS